MVIHFAETWKDDSWCYADSVIMVKTLGYYLLIIRLPGGTVVKNFPANAEDSDLIPRLERSLEKEMATHSSILAWEIPWTEEPDRLQSMGSQKSWK